MGNRTKSYLVFYGKLAANFAFMILFSCSSVKFVPDDRYLIEKVEVEIDNPLIGKEEAKSHVRQKENYQVLGFAKFHLWLYNLSSKENTESWLKRIGEPPEIYDPALTVASEERLKQYLGNRGFFRAKVETEVDLNDKKQKAFVKYIINTGDQYKIRDINYHFGDSVMRELFFQDSTNAFISPGTPFDYNLLEKQRMEIVNFFKNHGYYYFTNDDVSYLADSSKFEKEIILDLFVGTTAGQNQAKKFTPYYLNQFYISVLPGFVQFSTDQISSNQFSDTIRWEDHTLFSSPDHQYRPALFRNLLQMKSDSLYRLEDARHTFESFSRLRQFRFIDIQFQEPDLISGSNLLDSYIRLAPLSKQSVSFDIEGTNTSGNFGVAGNTSYLHRNMFRGAEMLRLNFRGAIERQQRTVRGNPEYFNTREIGTEASLTFPKIMGPRQIVSAFDDFLPKTVFTVGYNFQRRPEYTRTISNIKFGYNWMTSEYRQNIWNLVDFNMVRLYQFDPDFINLIEDLYIKSSFTDHLILASNYSVVYNTQRLGSMQNYVYLRFNAESAGNLFYLFSETLNRPLYQSVDTITNNTSEYYRILNTRFAQYIKSDLEFRYGYIIDKYNALIGRAFIGVGFPYGNFDVLPFEKKYFTGGANGIRAWQVRSLGPGTYRGPEDAYPNQSSDIKLEANLEYRFKLIAFMEGAFFLDAGNIWAINNKDNRPGAQFKFNKFYRQIALGTGTGLRLDFSYFIFRLDVGMKLRDPSQNSGNGWIIGKRNFTGDDFNLSFAIGYPF